MTATPVQRGWILRIIACFDLVLAMLCVATPLLRSRTSPLMANVAAGMLLFASVSMFLMARFVDRRIADLAAQSAS